MTGTVGEALQRWQTLSEGQFFERKGAWDYAEGRPRRRRAAEVAKDVAESASAMANADGGEIVVGLEDDGELTGIDFPPRRLDIVKHGPQSHCRPPVPARVSEHVFEGKLVLHFEVGWSPEVHDMTDGRTLLRIRDQNTPFSQAEVAALKRTKQQGLVERQFPLDAVLNDVDLDLAWNIRDLRTRYSGAEGPEELLAAYHLMEHRGERWVPNLACLLLFGRDPLRWHPRCDIDFVRFEGEGRETGGRLNVVGRDRIEAPLVVLIEQAYGAIQPHVRGRQELHDLFFEERFEYPSFAWQEAIVNAVAHRDYSVRGAAVEAHMFGDRLEVKSPGAPPEPVTMGALRSLQRVHASRNPLMVRVLTDLGYMRELGEGIPRMFEEMERAGCHPPELELVGGTFFLVRLRNELVYDSDMLAWLRRFKAHRLNGDQIRLLAYARAHGGTFTSRAYQKLTGKGIYQASRDIKDLIRKGIAGSQRKGGRVYEVLTRRRAAAPPAELEPLIEMLRARGFVRNADVRQVLGCNRRQALRKLKVWVDEGWLTQEGTRKATKYLPGAPLLHHF